MKKLIMIIAGAVFVVIGGATFVLASEEDGTDLNSVGEAMGVYLFDGDGDDDSPQADEEMFAEMDRDTHEFLVASLRINGVDDQEAQAYEEQIQQVAVKDQAQQKGVMPDESDVQARVEEQREMIEEGESEDGVEVRGSDETSERVEELAEESGITVDQYWEEYMPILEEVTLAEEALREKLVDENEIQGNSDAREAWHEQRDQIVDAYEDEHAEEIEAFKNE
ncbi:hypothetical protein B0H94_11162 [Salsuginibacillus halophilus]|uniref:Uncharacterized protein n=1 Tax=Salsuginibacillus halophilus TaxID=517424 RepID=A0A2P8HAJ1_9BACI|nr:hypothetical protein [Salsuginibacillus halophilus]PSL43238.1 hypothetical protein B0H94_11162 [Salsuginibacillus halophilus]